jgi:hypothetical protein
MKSASSIRTYFSQAFRWQQSFGWLMGRAKLDETR